MINQLCVNCDGRGFNWIKVRWRSNPHKVEYLTGSTCRMCRGTGQQPNIFQQMWRLIFA